MTAHTVAHDDAHLSSEMYGDGDANPAISTLATMAEWDKEQEPMDSHGTTATISINSLADSDSPESSNARHVKVDGPAETQQQGAKTISQTAIDTLPDKPFIHPAAHDGGAQEPLHVPNEICLMILRLLPLRDIKSVRLVSKPFSELGAGLLFQPFVFKPHRDDYQRFHTVALRPALVSGIKSIRFESGTMDIYHTVGELAYELSMSYNHALLGYRVGLYQETEKGSMVLEYARWNSKWRELKQDYKSISLLESIFRVASSLSSVTISKKACSFKNSSLLAAFARSNYSTHFQQTNDEFAALLTALNNASSNRLKSLAHGRVPVTFFAQGHTLLQNLIGLFKNLTTLHLTFDATEAPIVPFWKGLGYVLRSAENLSDLRFGFHPLERYISVEEVWYLSEDPGAWYLPLWKVFGNHKWTKLKKLRLDGLLVCENGLMELLTRHVVTLTNLHLCQIGLWEGSFESTLTSIRVQMKLQGFELSGKSRAFHAPLENWRVWPVASPYPFPCPSGMTFYTIAYLSSFDPDPSFPPDMFGKQLAAFVLGNGPWPLQSASGNQDANDDSHSPSCEDCIQTKVQIDEKWAVSQKENLDDWEVSEYADLLPGVDYELDDDVCEVYDENGYDDQGFNREGFHTSGLHYTDPLTQPEDGSIAGGSIVALRKDLLHEIKRNIPRYNEG